MSKKSIIIVSLVVALTFFLGRYSMNRVAINEVKAGYPTGYDVLNELNDYRHELDLPDFELYQPLCNNIASRWQSYKANNSHKGLQEFVDSYMSGLSVYEILTSGNTAQETVQNWKGSPSHDLGIRTYSKICVYSDDGLSVALLSN